MTKDLQKPALENVARCILDPRGAARHFSLKSYGPSRALAPFVEQYRIARWNLHNRPPYIMEALLLPDVSLAFMPEGPHVIGVVTGKSTYELRGSGTLVRVKFKPGGFYPFWQKAVAELTDIQVPATRVFSGATEAFNTELLALSDDTAIIARIERLLLDQHPIGDENIALIGNIINFIEEDSSVISVQVVARHFDMSERGLQKLFHTYVGVGPKWTIMRYRLREAAERASDQTNWTQIAADLGYNSQQHFTYDFKRIVGKSPSEYSKAIKQETSN